MQRRDGQKYLQERVTVRAHLPPTYIGFRRSINPLMLEDLCDYLLEKPGLYLEEMVQESRPVED
jgi:hypothetical protein